MTPDRSITYWDNLGGAESAKILFEQDTAPGHGNEPGEISFHTRPHDFDGGGVIQERMRILRNGNVGIGTPNPARLLHISNAMRLEPIERAPSSPSNGDLYYDNSGSHSLCIYINGSWSAIAGDGSCN